MDSTDTDLAPENDVVEETSVETPSEDNSAPEASEDSDLPALPPRKPMADCHVGDVLEARVVRSCS